MTETAAPYLTPIPQADRLATVMWLETRIGDCQRYLYEMSPNVVAHEPRELETMATVAEHLLECLRRWQELQAPSAT